jgi:hypothetical protein
MENLLLLSTILLHEFNPQSSLHKHLLNFNSYGVDKLYLIYDSKLII